MDKFANQMHKVSVPVSPWCLACPDFRAFIEQASKYGLTPNDIAVLALRSCQRPPRPNRNLDQDGAPLEHWQTNLPNCVPGDVLLSLEAKEKAAKYGVTIDI